jgi:two-component system phosphate regulon response regulator OmpR
MTAVADAPPSRVLPLPETAPHLLVIDDDSRLRTLLARFLGDNGYRVTVAANAGEARRRLAGLAFDLLIVDVMMPGENGIDLARSLRAGSTVPILMLTALSEPANRIAGLEAGADDYLPKPFEPRELLLRVNNILRRSRPGPLSLIEHVRFGPYAFHLRSGELRKGGELIALTEREREIMQIFAEAPGETIARERLLGGGPQASERTIDVQINRLRRKLEESPGDPMYLQTVRGIGYRLVTEP